MRGSIRVAAQCRCVPVNSDVRPRNPPSLLHLYINSRKIHWDEPMESLKKELLIRLEEVEGLQALPSQVAGGTALFYKGKEFAHFHNDNEIDLRLTKRLIRSLGLSHPERSALHPTRALSSNWIEVRFHTSEEVRTAVQLVRQAVSVL